MFCTVPVWMSYTEISTLPHLGSLVFAASAPIARTDPTMTLPSSTMMRGSMNHDHAPLSFRRISPPAT